MTRGEIYDSCLTALSKSNCLLLEAATGFGKSKCSIDLVNHLCDTVYKGKKIRMLLLVAKRVHKQTWKDEFEKWGGIKVEAVITECYESLHKYQDECFDIVVSDETHHIGSEARLEILKTIKFGYFIGLSATIPNKLKMYFKYQYHSQIVSCDLVEAIDSYVLPEPQILLMPLQLDNTQYTETWEVNPRARGPVVYGSYKDLWKYKKEKIHAILSCTQKQKSNELNSQILWEKNQAMRTRNEVLKQMWLHHCGQRLEFYADCKIPIVKEILDRLKKYRTITFCKTIEQTEKLGKHCIHSQNKDATEIYNKFNQKKISHITAVNILNENANLVDCKYAIFCNLSSSEVCMPQRLGRSMRHKSPVIIMPYFKGTREEEIIDKYIEGFNPIFIKTISSVQQI